MIQTNDIECEVFLENGKCIYGTVEKIKWLFDYSLQKQGVFSMSVLVDEQELNISYSDYNYETGEDDQKEVSFFIKDNFKQVELISEVENFLHGFSISSVRIDMKKQKMEVVLK